MNETTTSHTPPLPTNTTARSSACVIYDDCGPTTRYRHTRLFQNRVKRIHCESLFIRIFRKWYFVNAIFCHHPGQTRFWGKPFKIERKPVPILVLVDTQCKDVHFSNHRLSRWRSTKDSRFERNLRFYGVVRVRCIVMTTLHRNRNTIAKNVTSLSNLEFCHE